MVLAYAMVEIDKSAIFLDGEKLTPEASVLDVSDLSDLVAV